MESIKCDKKVVILTQPKGYVKGPNKLMPLLKLLYRKYPNMLEKMKNRHIEYNKQVDYVNRCEEKGNIFVIRPDEKLDIGHICHDSDRIEAIYAYGRKIAGQILEDLKNYLSE